MKTLISTGLAPVTPRRAADDADAAPAPRTGSPVNQPRARAGNSLLSAHEPNHPRCASIRALRAELLLRRGALDRADVLVLLSPGAGEGRSLLAADLAIGMAQSGARTLLVDADLRRPQQHLLFGTSNAPGLVQALATASPPLMRPVQDLPGLSLLTAGEVLADPLELLSRARFSAMVEDWRSDYRFVVIDTAPVSTYADGLVIANVVGRVLVLTRAQHTRQRDLQSMLDRLAGTHSDVVGAVISRF